MFGPKLDRRSMLQASAAVAAGSFVESLFSPAMAGHGSTRLKSPSMMRSITIPTTVAQGRLPAPTSAIA